MLHVTRRHASTRSTAAAAWRARTSAQRCVLGIETSFDDTGVAIVDDTGRVLSDFLASDWRTHSPFKGVVPRLAAQQHARILPEAIASAMRCADIAPGDLAAVAVTVGPGLGPCLGAGLAAAVEAAGEWRVPLVQVNHMEAHLTTASLVDPDVRFPFLTLLVSGGHSQLVLAHAFGHYTILGSSLDDAIGEAFDKTARLLDLTDGRGAAVETAAATVLPEHRTLAFPVPMQRRAHDMHFSFAGLKTSVARRVHRLRSTRPGGVLRPDDVAHVAAGFQHSALTHVVQRVRRAIHWCRMHYPAVSTLVSAGGVASNAALTAALADLTRQHGMRLSRPPPPLCVDNGVMIAWTGVQQLQHGVPAPAHPWRIDLPHALPQPARYHPALLLDPTFRLDRGIPSCLEDIL